MSLLDDALNPFGKFLRSLREWGLEYTSGRYYSKYMGIVTDTADPQGQGRVRVTCEVATGRDDEIDRWALPTTDYAGQDKGFYSPPDVGDVVWVWFDHGDRTQPRYSGSFWCNPGTTKTRSTSYVPAEFVAVSGPPTARGFKTKAGHGWLFEDDVVKGKRFEVWTGEQTTPAAAATKHHRVILTDASGAEEIKLQSFKGHTRRSIDIAGLEGIEDVTAGSLFMRLQDWLGVAEIGGSTGFKLSIDEKTGVITLKTAAGNKIEMIEGGSIINIQDITGNSVKLSPAGVDIVAPAAVNVTSAAVVNIAAGAAAAITAAGALTVSGAGLSVSSTGGAPSSQVASGVTNNSFVGLKSETLAGGLAQTVLGLWSIAAVIVEIIAPSLNLGTPGTKFFLVDSRFLTLFNAHQHTAIGLGTPTSAPLTPATIGLQTTTAVAAN